MVLWGEIALDLLMDLPVERQNGELRKGSLGTLHK
jgi:hypothetical protein